MKTTIEKKRLPFASRWKRSGLPERSGQSGPLRARSPAYRAARRAPLPGHRHAEGGTGQRQLQRGNHHRDARPRDAHDPARGQRAGRARQGKRLDDHARPGPRAGRRHHRDHQPDRNLGDRHAGAIRLAPDRGCLEPSFRSVYRMLRVAAGGRGTGRRRSGAQRRLADQGRHQIGCRTIFGKKEGE